MFYYLYQITNNVNGKIYVGVHKTKSLDDGYMGSGKIINRAIKKYGIDNFEKDILEFFENQELMYAREKEIVTEELLQEKHVYNLRRGGLGGWDYINKHRTIEQRIEIGLKGGFANKHKWSETLKNEVSKVLSETCKKTSDDLWKYRFDEMNSYRKKAFEASLSYDSISRRKETLKQRCHQQGDKNSQYGTCWIIKDGKSKKILKEELNEFLKSGWNKGRKHI